MPRRKFIDKKSATTFQLVHRAQNDPLIHDDTASSMVFREMGPSQPGKDTPSTPSSSSARGDKVKSRSDLESLYGTAIRPNEGEAANYGVYYDDTEYDYMQHIKDLGNEGGVFVPVKEDPSEKNRKGKGKQTLDEALKQLDLSETRSQSGVSMSSTASSRADQYFDQSMLPSEFVQGRYEVLRSQQDVPDDIAGFQPDMDPRLREVLEALEDEAYVDDTEDVFEELTGGGAADELDQMTFEEQAFWDDEEEDDGWESDATIKASPAPTPGPKSPATTDTDLPPPEPTEAPPDAHEDGEWLAEYSKFKKDTKTGKAPAVKPVDASVMTGTTGLTGLSRTGKKRKGALTNPSTYSMTSSSLVRTEQHTLLDARFDKIEEEYADEDAFPDDDTGSMVSGMSKMSAVSGMSRASAWSQTPSEAPQLTAQFNSVLDDFLGSHNRAGKHKQRVRKGKPMSGLENLDEVRKGLGPARLNGSKSGFSVLRADT